MITGTGLVTRGLVEGLGAAGSASRGLITEVEPGTTAAPGAVTSYQPRHWERRGTPGAGAAYRRRNQ